MKISERCPALSEFKEKLSWEVNTYKKFIAPQRNQGAWTVFKDLTGVGALHSMGMDWSHLKRSLSTWSWLKATIPQTEKELGQQENTKMYRSVTELRNLSMSTFDGLGNEAISGIAMKAAYVSSFALGTLSFVLGAEVGMVLGAVGAVLATGAMVANAAYRADDAKSTENTTRLLNQMLNNLGEQLNQEIAAAPKAGADTVQPSTAPAA